MNPEGKFKIEQHILEMIRFSDDFRLKRNVLIEVDDISRMIHDEIVVRIEKMVACDLVAADHEVVEFDYEYPNSTWQTFKNWNKRHWWMGWFVRRFPVKFNYETMTKVVLINRYLAYPEAEIQSPRLGRSIIYEKVTQLDI